MRVRRKDRYSGLPETLKQKENRIAVLEKLISTSKVKKGRFIAYREGTLYGVYKIGTPKPFGVMVEFLATAAEGRYVK